MHAILVTVGTGGDVFPYIGLGRVLRARGHRVTVVAPEDFESLAREHGLEFHPVVSLAEGHEVLSNPDFWHPIKAGRVAARWGMRLVERQYELVARLASDEDAVLVANPGIVAAKIASDKLGRPLANILLQPWLIPSSIAPPVFLGSPFPKWTPRWGLKLFWRLVEAAGDLVVARDINRIRTLHGLPPERRFFKNWLSRELVIGMFPEWYGPPQSDWPPQVKLAGFPLFDGGSAKELPADLLEFCRAGTPPIVFTFGTGMMHAQKLFARAIEVCRLLSSSAGSPTARAVFLTRYTEQLPHPLPSFVRHHESASFQALFPHCRAVVHHGGVGTTANALAAGLPQLILPFAYDQSDNAARVKSMGAGDWIKQRRATPRTIARALESLSAPEIRARCGVLAARFEKNDTFERSANLIEELTGSHGERLTAKRLGEGGR
jgi:rhamnosyltransferase subunit B